jgi:pectate lyase
MTKSVLLAFSLLLAGMCAPVFARALAFPSAEGYGKYATGGRGGRVIVVSNLNDAGAGSLRDAVEQEGKRIIVFSVSGTIDLKSTLRLANGDVTIAGQSAPGDGICLKGYPFSISGSNVIIRYLRFRLGDVNSVENDALTGGRCKDVIVDHCSASWSVDECLSLYKIENLTVQYCMVAQSLSKSLHFKGAHGFGGIWGGNKASFHHNLLAHHSSRNPRFASDGSKSVDFRNNVIYNWGFKSAYGGGQHGEINMVANYYKPGPATRPDVRSCIVEAAVDGTSAYYLADNVVEGYPEVSQNNWLGAKGNFLERRALPVPFEPLSLQTASEAYDIVLREAGCSHRRDSYDRMIVEQVRAGVAGKGGTFDGGSNGIIDSQEEVGGWPELRSLPAPEDTDGDGMSDAWEKANRLNPSSAEDASEYTLSKEYTNIEVYLNCGGSISDFSASLKPVGRILEMEGYYVWCCAPIYDEKGRTHVFYSRWEEKYGMGGWINHSEIAHAVADHPEGTYVDMGVVLAPRAGYFDATTCHNPHVRQVNGAYCLFYMGNSDGTVFTKRIGLAVAKTLDGPWERTPEPLLEAGAEGQWDDCNTTNPAFLLHADGKAWLYYKSWNSREYRSQTGKIRANRKYGLAVADSVNGKYERYEGNPVVDFSIYGNNRQVEDAYIYASQGKYYMLMRDMGYYDHTAGLIFESEDGLRWSLPKVAWFGVAAYFQEPPAPKHLSRYGRLERPQMLMKDGSPDYLFCAAQGGKYSTASGVIFKITAPR